MTRTISNSDPDPEQTIDVTVSLRNSSGSTLADLRVIDGVPAGLTVTEGSPRFTTALRPGKEATFTYSVRAVSGHHEFDPLLCITRGVTGTRKREALIDGGSSAITCLPPEPPELNRQRRPQTIHLGRTKSTVTGSGVEFHSVRDYRPGDPLARINWKQKAKTGELTTIDFRESRLTTVMVVIDARETAYLAPANADDRPLIHQSLSAARYVTAQLLSESIPVGIAALSPQACWLPPSTGDAHRSRIRTTLATDPAFSWDIPETEVAVSAAVEEFSQRVSQDTQILFVAPLCDDDAKHAAQRLDARGYTVTVVSPDPTKLKLGKPDCALSYASLTRQFRLGDLPADIAVLDWNPNQPFEEVFLRES